MVVEVPELDVVDEEEPVILQGTPFKVTLLGMVLLASLQVPWNPKLVLDPGTNAVELVSYAFTVSPV